MGVDATQLRVRCCIARLHTNSELEQTSHAGCRLGVTNVGLDATHSQWPTRDLARCEHGTDQRASLDGIAERCARTVRLHERKLPRGHRAVHQRGDEESLLCWAAWSRETRRAPVLPHSTPHKAQHSKRANVALQSNRPAALATAVSVGTLIECVGPALWRRHSCNGEASANSRCKHKRHTGHEAIHALCVLDCAQARVPC